nr:HAMP domain-containing sensor histidine kinase [Ectobacillus ponti]
MSKVAEDLLINLLCVFAVFFLVYLYHDRKPRTERQRLYVLILCSMLGIIACMFFSIPLNEQFRLDLRQIPLMLGGLYGGIVPAVLLAAVTMAYRVIQGGEGIYSTFIILALQVAGLYLILPYFRSMNTNKRILTTSCLALAASLNVIVVMWLMFQRSVPPWDIWLWYLIIPVLGTAGITYVIESMNRSSLLRTEIARAEKMSIVSHMAASISHEVRNPLTVVRGMLQLLQYDDFAADKRHMFLRTSITELDRAESIISDYLAFAKPMPDKLQYLNVVHELLHTVTMVQPLANMNTVQITTNMKTAAAVVQGDKQRVQQCFLNIMKNCIEAMPKGGLLKIHALQQDSDVQVLIQDTGIGMTKEQVARLGEPYFSTKDSGTGLGMMVVFSIIDAMHGKMKVESEPGKGTRFCITLPLAVAYPEAAATQQ